jgi:lipopolysaccharide assembly protein B
MEGFSLTDLFLYLLLLVALGLGWGLGRRARNYSSPESSRPYRNLPAKDYFIGLNYLLNDEPDGAIDLFMDALEINSGTLETHMALGTLLRRRGKVDRSIAVYQDLLGQNGFSNTEMNKIKINLVQSYIAAGLLDRAENLLEELRNEKGGIKVKALMHSANVYQIEKDWLEGVKVLSELLRVCAPKQRLKYQNIASHFYCELAEEALENEHLSRSREFLQHASGMDKNNVRVSILRGRLEDRCGNYPQAIKSYLQVKKQDPGFMADVFYLLIECYKKAGKEKGLKKFVEASIKEETNTTVLLGLAQYLQQEKGEFSARTFILEQLNRKPSLRLLLQSMHYNAQFFENDESADGVASKKEAQLSQSVLAEYIDTKTQYQCINCGFELKSLHWLCPSCSHWGTVKHVKGILGE